MATPITAKTITKQFGGNYLIGIIMLALAAAILVFCGIFCGTQLGWTNLLTIILLIALAACIVFIVVLLIKTALAKNHPSLKRHGGAAQLAARINEGPFDLQSHVRNWRSKGPLAPWMRPTKFPEIPVSLERNTEVFRHPLL